MGAPGDARIRDLLISTATEELSHIEMLGYTVALSLDTRLYNMTEDKGMKDSFPS